MPEPETETDVRVGFITAPDLEVGSRLARALVDEGLAACVNLVPGVHSIYRYEGAVHEDAEVLLVVKTRAGRSKDLAKRVQELHPYDVPELLLMPVSAGSQAYLEWVQAEVMP